MEVGARTVAARARQEPSEGMKREKVVICAPFGRRLREGRWTERAFEVVWRREKRKDLGTRTRQRRKNLGRRMGLRC